ncbi:MAG: hypothetical protein ACRD5H_13760, partial [Nitrososphaerales archaeon]
SKTWGGNGATGARSNALGRASGYRLLGKATFGIGTAISTVNLVQDARQGNYAGAAKNGLDIGMGTVGLVGGPVGAGVSAAYIVTDTVIGWDKVGNEAAKSLNKKAGDIRRISGLGIGGCWSQGY